MAVMGVGIVRMPMQDGGVPVRMAVPVLRALGMIVIMMLVMAMLMVVIDGFVPMAMFVMFGEVQPNAESHQRRGDRKPHRDRLAHDEDGDCRADERGCREIGSGPGRAKMAQSDDEQAQTDAITEETHDGRAGQGLG